MKVSDFDFNLPKELIAQSPLLKRATSKLMVIDKKTGHITHENFYNIINYLNEDDVLVLNETKVLPARLIGFKEITNAKIELLLLKEIESDIWEALVKPAKRIKPGDIVKFSNILKAECLSEKEEGIKTFKLIYEGLLIEVLEQLGEMPLPPYITEKLKEKDRYQTVYAKDLGSAAAPTAGLHFTKELLDKIKDKGIKVLFITLHVGLGTFRPVSVMEVLDHKMHSETYYISEDTKNTLNDLIKSGKNIVAVGTTTVRALESNYKDNSFHAGTFDTNIFIYPGYKYKVVKSLITNFHLPKSSLIMLVSAFTNKEMILNAYQTAIKNEYRFFSFGDAMLIKEEC